MKRFYTLLVSLALIFTLVGCGGGSDKKDTGESKMAHYYEVTTTSGNKYKCDSISTTDEGLTCINFPVHSWFDKDIVSNIEYK